LYDRLTFMIFFFVVMTFFCKVGTYYLFLYRTWIVLKCIKCRESNIFVLRFSGVSSTDWDDVKCLSCARNYFKLMCIYHIRMNIFKKAVEKTMFNIHIITSTSYNNTFMRLIFLWRVHSILYHTMYIWQTDFTSLRIIFVRKKKLCGVTRIILLSNYICMKRV